MRLLISAAEPSGDRLAAELITALSARTDVDARGVAGPLMRAAGVTPVARMEDIAVMGLVEVLRNLGPIRAASAAMSAEIEAGADLILGVDAPDFNLPLARKARAKGIPAVGYVSPQIWVWRKGRAKKISAGLDQLLCLFAFEPELYPDLDARWVGHPVIDRLPRPVQAQPHLYGLLPGSRRQELSRMLPPFLETARLLHAREPRSRFRLVLPSALHDGLPPLPGFVTVMDGGAAALSGCRAALTKSGTITLELAVMGIPQIVAHRVHPLTYWVGRMVITGVNHIALPNILAGGEVVPEYVQRFTPQILADALIDLPGHQPVDLSALGGAGASQRAAEAILSRWK
ncbi:MAG: lipid-A-disaccharide synthase [Myxococcota bacterium]|jgi:lipid-A-disaccharide synthase